jgi:hypothetical protein
MVNRIALVGRKKGAGDGAQQEDEDRDDNGSASLRRRSKVIFAHAAAQILQ